MKKTYLLCFFIMFFLVSQVSALTVTPNVVLRTTDTNHLNSSIFTDQQFSESIDGMNILFTDPSTPTIYSESITYDLSDPLVGQVPEPSTMVLFSLGLMIVGVLSYRKKYLL